MAQKKKLLITADSPILTTGLSRCVRELANSLVNKYEIRIAGWHHTPTAHPFPFHIYPLSKAHHEEPRQLHFAFTDFNPDLYLGIGDLWDFFETAPIIREYRTKAKIFGSVFWLTVDGENLHPSWISTVQAVDKVAVFSKFGQKILKDWSNMDTLVVYPGIDQNTFKVLDRELVYSKTRLDPRTNMIFLIVSQNTDRKAIPLALEGFSRFARDKEDVFLIVATDPRDQNGYELWNMVRKFGVDKKVAISQNCNPKSGMADAKLNLLYNIATALISTSIGEGYGMFFNEAMINGVVPIATNYSTPPEILSDGRGLLIDVAAFLYGAYGLKRAIISLDSLVNQLNILYSDWKGSRQLITQMSEKCKAHAQMLTWDKTVQQLDGLLTESFEKRARPWVRNAVQVKDVRLLQVIPSWGKHCGIAEYTKELCDKFEQQRKETFIYPSADLKGLMATCREHNINVVHFQHEYSFFSNKNEFEDILKQLNESGIKIIVTLHTLNISLKSYNQMLIDICDKILVHSSRFVKEFKNVYNNVQNIEFITMGCKELVKRSHGIIQETKKNLDISNRYPIIGSFGFLRDQKGFQEIALAVKELKKDYPNICFLLISPKHEFGDLVYDEEFFRFLEREKMDTFSLILREYLPEKKLIKVLQTIDLFVLNYKDSPIGGGISAAVKTLMRSGRPIITSNSIAFWDLEKGEVFKNEFLSVDVMTTLIEKVLKDESIQGTLVNTAAAFLNFANWESVSKKHWDIYME